jgi:hypothetical protein
MSEMISCLVNRKCKVYTQDGVHSHSGLAKIFGIKQDKCLAYEFDLVERQLVQDFDMDGVPFKPKASHDLAAQEFFNRCAGTPERLIAYVRRGNWDDALLSLLLTFVAWKKLDGVLDAADKRYNKTIDVADKKCSKALVVSTVQEYTLAYKKYKKVVAAAEKRYDKACMQAWVKLFRNPRNRIPAWRDQRKNTKQQ